MTRGKRLAGTPRKGWAITQTGVHSRVLAWTLAWVLALAVVAPAFALGLGQIQVRSQPGEPLLAEIPIVTSDPSELDNLQARLASPDTFRRIGLPPPEGIVSDLQFAVALDARGNPVIRVTSAAPVQQPVLNFLIEVDWGQGRLVREYAALLDAPRTVSAPAQPPIQEPAASPADSIVRPPEPPPAVAVEPDPEPVPATPEQAEPPPADARVVMPAPAPASPPTQSSEDYLVQAGDTLGRIAAGMRQDGYTLDQTMLALLRANPDAFIAGNINLVRQGAVLRMPQGDALSQYTAAEARAVVREQIGQWREMRRAAAQPEAVAGEAAGAPAGAAAGAGAGPRVADARLEIVPPSQGSGQRAGTRSGIEAGGEGDMLRQELQQTRETLAARDAEVEELKARLAEIEQLQQQQQQLISLKDSELAAAQQRLAESNQQAATTQTATPTSTETTAAAGGLAWLWIGLALLAAAALAWLWMRRSRPVARPRVFDTSALAAGMPPPATRPQAEVDVHTEADPAPGQADGTPAVADRTPLPGATAEAVMPTWHAGSPRAASAADDAATSVSINPAPAGHERIELARAYLDLGDTDTARSLLREIVDGGDAEAREQASRLLRDLA